VSVEPASAELQPVEWLGIQITRARVLAAVVVVTAVWGWVDVRVRGTVDPASAIHKTDFTVYTEAGAAFFDGRNPYQVTNPRGWGYLYPPLFAILVSPLHHLPTEYQVLVWFALSVAMAWGCYLESVRIGRIALPDEPQRGPFGAIPNWLGWSAVATALIPALNCLQRGQVSIAKLYLLLLGVRLLIESRSRAKSFVAGWVLALPIVLKLTPLLPVGIVLVQEFVAVWRARFGFANAAAAGVGTLAGLCACLFLIPAALVGWNDNLRHLNSWSRWVAVSGELKNDSFAGDGTSLRNQSFTNAAVHLGNWTAHMFVGGPADNADLKPGESPRLMDSTSMRELLLSVRAGELLLLAVLALGMGLNGAPAARVAGFALACIATLIVAPIARAHYYTLMYPAVLFPALWLASLGRLQLAKVIACVPIVLVWGHYLALNQLGRIGWLGLGTTAWFTFTASVLIVEALRQRMVLSRAVGPKPITDRLERPLAA
jgi:hypothetical protein